MGRSTTTKSCPHCGEVLPRVVDAFCPQCGEPLDEGAAVEVSPPAGNPRDESPAVPATPVSGNPYESPQLGASVARGKSRPALVVLGLFVGSFLFTLLITPGDPVSVTTVFPPTLGLSLGVYLFAGWSFGERRPHHALLGWLLGLAIILMGSILLLLTITALLRDEMLAAPDRSRPADELNGG